MRSAASVVRPQLQPGVELRVEVPEVASHVMTDGLMLMQVLLNLMQNAARFTKQGFVCVRCTVQQATGGAFGWHLTDEWRYVDSDPKAAIEYAMMKGIKQEVATTTFITQNSDLPDFAEWNHFLDQLKERNGGDANAMKGKAPPPPTQAERPQTVAWGVPRAPAAPALNGATATVGRAPSPPRARVPRRNNLVLFSSYSLRFACNPPSEAGRTREAAGLWDGLNYLLKMCTDVWRLPLPTMTDPFFLRWFQDSEYAAERTSAMSEVQRMMEAETILKRLLPHANVNSMAAVETTISLQMTRPYATHLSLKSPGRQMEAYAEATNWRVLSAVLYPPDGPRAQERLHGSRVPPRGLHRLRRTGSRVADALPQPELGLKLSDSALLLGQGLLELGKALGVGGAGAVMRQSCCSHVAGWGSAAHASQHSAVVEPWSDR